MHRPLYIFVVFICTTYSKINCNIPHKICIFYPEQQYPVIEVGFETNESHITLEILHHRLEQGHHVAVSYSNDAQVGDDVVVYCGRNQTENVESSVLEMFVNMGISRNTDFSTPQILGNMIWQSGKPFYAEPLEYKQNGEETYCRIRHQTSEIFSILNSTKGHLLISQGPWLNRFALPSREAFDLGFFDFQNSASRNHMFLISLITYYVY